MTSPDVAFNRPFICLANVVFPAPLLPTMAFIVLFFIIRLILSNAFAPLG